MFTVKFAIFEKCNAVRKRKEIVENIMKKEYHHIHLGRKQEQLAFPDGWIQAEHLPHLVGSRTLYVEIQEIRIELDESKVIPEKDEDAHKTFERWANDLRKLIGYEKIELIV